MKKVLPLLSWLALAGIVIPPILYFTSGMAHDNVKTVTLGATVLWFAVTPFWMNSRTQG
jgi:hypothetical protein